MAAQVDHVTHDFSAMKIDQGQNTIRIVLLGKTGNGKSSTGNTILGKTAFRQADGLESVTSECKRATGCRGDTKLEVLDCPGLCDTKKSQDEICTIVVQAVAGMHPGPHALLYVIKAGGRYTEEEYATYERLKALFDDDMTKHMILLATGGDSLKGVKGGEAASAHIVNKIDSSRLTNLQDVLRECGRRLVVFDNTDASDKEPQVKYLFEQVRNMMKRNGGRPYVCPRYEMIGTCLEKEVERRVREFEKANVNSHKHVQADLETVKAELKEFFTQQMEELKQNIVDNRHPPDFGDSLKYMLRAAGRAIRDYFTGEYCVIS